MDLRAFNFSAVLNVFRLILKPTLCLEHASIKTFADLPIPLNKALAKSKDADIRAVVLDKDNCFAYPKQNTIYKPYEKHFQRLREAYPGRRLLIVSNTAGAKSVDPDGTLAKEVEKETGVTVLFHSTKKPGCGPGVISYFQRHPETGVTRPDQIAVAGDRVLTDVMMANSMGSFAVFIDGILPENEKSMFARLELRLVKFLAARGYRAPDPSGQTME